jgi:hypothetical protein
MFIKFDTSPEWGTEEWWEDPTGCGWVDSAGKHWMFIDKKWRVVNADANEKPPAATPT